MPPRLLSPEQYELLRRDVRSCLPDCSTEEGRSHAILILQECVAEIVVEYIDDGETLSIVPVIFDIGLRSFIANKLRIKRFKRATKNGN